MGEGGIVYPVEKLVDVFYRKVEREK